MDDNESLKKFKIMIWLHLPVPSPCYDLRSCDPWRAVCAILRCNSESGGKESY